jgi:hypothetical protein
MVVLPSLRRSFLPRSRWHSGPWCSSASSAPNWPIVSRAAAITPPTRAVNVSDARISLMYASRVVRSAGVPWYRVGMV